MSLREIFQNKKGSTVILILDVLFIFGFLVITIVYLIFNQEDASLMLSSIKETLR